jgi:hypothetical protein
MVHSFKNMYVRSFKLEAEESNEKSRRVIMRPYRGGSKESHGIVIFYFENSTFK